MKTDLKILVTKCCPLIKTKRQRRGTTIRSSDSLHSYRTSMFAMSTKNTSNTGHSLVTMNSIRNNQRRDSDNNRVNGKTKVMSRVSQIEWKPGLIDVSLECHIFVDTLTFIFTLNNIQSWTTGGQQSITKSNLLKLINHLKYRTLKSVENKNQTLWGQFCLLFYVTVV